MPDAHYSAGAGAGAGARPVASRVHPVYTPTPANAGVCEVARAFWSSLQRVCPGSVYLHAYSPVARSSCYISAPCLTCCRKAAHWGHLASLPGSVAYSFLALAHASRSRESAKHTAVVVLTTYTAAVACGCLDLPSVLTTNAEDTRGGWLFP